MTTALVKPTVGGNDGTWGQVINDALDYLNSGLTDAVVEIGKRMTVVSHGSAAGTGRPSSALPVLWIGTVDPTNATARDILFREDLPTFKRYTGAGWTASGGLSSPLAAARFKIATDPANFKMCLLGDSTSDQRTGASTIYRRLYGLHTQQGEALHGVGSLDSFTDGVANGTTTFTSATAAFTSADVGLVFHGKGVPLATVVASVTNSTTVTLSNAVPAGTGLQFWVGRHIIGGGNNGMTLGYWMANPNFTAVNGPYNQAKFFADAPDATIASWLFNDIRQGLLGTTVNAIVAAGTALLQSFVDLYRTNLPNSPLLLRMPNTILTADVAGYHFVTDASATVNPAGLAQIYSTALRRIYLSFIGKYPNVDVIDIQAEVFGTTSSASHVYNVDQLHPSSATSGDVNGIVPVGGGYVAIADALAKRMGFKRNGFPPELARRFQHDLIVYAAPGAGQVQFISRDYNVPAPQVPVFTTDSLYVNGLDGPIALTSASVDRIVGTNILQMTGLGTTDFTPYIGKAAAVLGDHAGWERERQQIFIDLPSIPAGGTTEVAVTLPGVNHGSTGKGVTVTAAPGGGFANTSGLYLLSCYPSSTDTLKLVIWNSTGSAIDKPGESWTFEIQR